MTCPACRATASARAMVVREFDFHRCRSCASLFCVNPPEALDAVYADDSYFVNPDFDAPQTAGFRGYRDYLADRRFIEAKFARVLERVEGLRGPGDLLDVGCGPGFLLAAARERGWRPIGIDLNGWAAAYAREELGLDARAVALDGAGFSDATFDAVTMMDLIEHVPDPDVLVAGAVRLLRPGGVLAVLTPDAGSPVSRALGRRWPEVQRAPEHLVLFSARGLAALLGRHGLEVRARHSIGKETDVRTLVSDVAPAAPGISRALARAAERTGLAGRVVDVDPRTKFVMYATR